MIKVKKYIQPEAEKKLVVSVRKNSCDVFEKACGVEFLKHGSAVNFFRVVGVDP